MRPSSDLWILTSTLEHLEASGVKIKAETSSILSAAIAYVRHAHRDHESIRLHDRVALEHAIADEPLIKLWIGGVVTIMKLEVEKSLDIVALERWQDLYDIASV